MSGIPSKCPKCGKESSWKEEINPFKSGIPLGSGFIRLRIGAPSGLLGRQVRKALGCYKVTYRCHKCGFRKEYPTEDA